jgi:hypothetical protein
MDNNSTLFARKIKKFRGKMRDKKLNENRERKKSSDEGTFT